VPRFTEESPKPTWPARAAADRDRTSRPDACVSRRPTAEQVCQSKKHDSDLFRRGKKRKEKVRFGAHDSSKTGSTRHLRKKRRQGSQKPRIYGDDVGLAAGISRSEGFSEIGFFFPYQICSSGETVTQMDRSSSIPFH
jgi:hypothetical protein